MIFDLQSASGAQYEVDKIEQGRYQYIDRDYRFLYIPEELNALTHIKTRGNDKLISELDPCFSFRCETDIAVYVLFADKFPVIPRWLEQFSRPRFNVTRYDSNPESLKGYFSVYRKEFPKGLVTLNGCSPDALLRQDWYLESGGINYCMYTVFIREKDHFSVSYGRYPNKTI